MGAPFCTEGTPRHAAIMLGVFTLVGCILWLSWQTQQIIYLRTILTDNDNPCDPNPCLHGGVCIGSRKGDNELGYVCDCLGTGFQGINCNASEVQRISKKSCGEYFLEGHREDGYFFVDPDGPSSNILGPLRVRCEFDDYRAYTHLEHEYGGVRHLSQHYINSYGESRHGEKYIVMEARYLEYLNFYPRILSAEQITVVKSYFDHIINQSQHCEQTFSFKCKKWPLTTRETSATTNTQFYGGTALLGELLTLVAPDFSMTTPAPDPNVTVTDIPILLPNLNGSISAVPNNLEYALGFNGTNILGLDMSGETFNDTNSAKCPCFFTDTCDDEGSSSSSSDINKYHCNCDRDEDVFANDVAVFTKEKHRRYLPITSIFLSHPAPTDDVEAFAELSPLSCYEDFEVIDPFSKTRDGGYGKGESNGISSWMRGGYEIMWGVMIAFMVITALLLLASFVFLMGIMLSNGGPVIFYLIQIVLMNIMVFIVLVVRWYYLGFEAVVWGLAVKFLWMMITFYGMAGVISFLDHVNQRG